MYLHDQSKNFSIFEINVLWLDFIDPSQNHYLFHQLPAKIAHILEIPFKEIVHIRYQSWGKKIKVNFINWV